jgi:hypothetical protein
MEMIHCGICKFWSETKNNNGECHRHAPQATNPYDAQYPTGEAVWPITGYNVQCGDSEMRTK